MTLLRAPLGFGKTVAAAQWAQSRPEQLTAWVSVDRDSAETDGFWHAVMDALLDIGIQLPAAEQGRSTRSRIRRALAATGREVVLVVDSFERVGDADLEADLLDLLRASRHLRLVVCLRGQRHFPDHMSLDVDMRVITPGELRLTVDETAILLAEVGVSLPAARIRTIQADGGGWVEPTRALALALAASPSTVPAADGDGETTTEVARAYLRDRILPAIGGERLDLALATSLVDPFGPDLAEFLSEDPRTEAHLQSLEADGLLHAQRRQGEVEYRWPPAARRALATELERRFPERVRPLHTRAARWYASRDHPELALDHALRTEEWPYAVQLVEREWRSLLVNHPDLLHRAMAVIPAEEVSTSPRALAMRDVRLRYPDDHILDTFPPLPTDREALRHLGAGPDAADILDTGMAMLIVLHGRGLLARALDHSRRLEVVAAAARVAQPSKVAADLPGLWGRAGLIHLMADDIPGAHEPLRAAYRWAADSPFDYIARDASGKLALASAISGDLPEAEVWLARHDEAPIDRGWLGPMSLAAANVARILIALERLDLDRAGTLAATTLAELQDTAIRAYNAYARARVALDAGDALGGLHQLDRFRRANATWHQAGTTAQLLLARVETDLLLALGRADQAQACLQAAGTKHPRLQVSAARLALFSGHPQRAVDLATRVAWTRQADRRSQLEMLLVQAVAHHRLDQPAPAADALARALGAAGATGSLRPFTTVPRAELTRIAEGLPTGAPLLDAPRLQARSDLFPAQVELVDLTRREQVVLGKIARGLLVQEIAAEMYISTSTVKTHLKAIYQKLGVASRQDAAARAHRLGFVADGAEAPPAP